MKQTIRKIPFDVYLPASATKEAVFVETIEVEVYENFGEGILTPESSELIERTRARHMGFLHGKDIRVLRKRMKLTQDELSVLLDCGEKSLSRWESGRGFPLGIVNTLLRLLESGKVSVESLRAVRQPRSLSSDNFNVRSTTISRTDKNRMLIFQIQLQSEFTTHNYPIYGQSTVSVNCSTIQ